ncbi:MAG: hypothetical protein JSW39_08085 [Desulfobacterales bacterium]|nr:MAG: hypothetical protein JSW39_08085 [Desulfobacterales bacterium]
MNPKSNKRPQTRPFFMMTLTVLGMMATVLAGCSSKYGSLKQNPDLTRLFENNEVLPDYKYYYSGFERIPHAIIGIHKRYTLQTRVWKDIDLSRTTLNQWVFRMKAVYRPTPRGAWIVDAEGERLGIWYSSQYWTTVRTGADSQISVAAPEPPDLRGIP